MDAVGVENAGDPSLLPAINLFTLNGLPRSSRGPRARFGVGLSKRGYRELAALGIRGVQEQVGLPISHEQAARHAMARFGAAIVTEANVHTKAEKWKRAGCAAATVLIGTGYEDLSAASRRVEAVLDASVKSGLPIHLETHRGTLTQELGITLALCERFPELTLNADLSHYVTGHRLLEQPSHVIDALDPLLERVRFVHARLSDSTRVQLQDGEGSPSEALFVELWTRIFEHLHRRADPGEALPFAPEILPAMTGYAHVDPARPGYPEVGCRFEEALRLIALAKRCFESARSRVMGEEERTSTPSVTHSVAGPKDPSIVLARRVQDLNAATLPEASHIRLRLGNALGASIDELSRWAEAVDGLSRRADCPVYLETRRGTLAGSVGGASRLLELCPDLQLDLDLPEWMLAHEVMPHTQANASRAIAPVLGRVGLYRLRASTGERLDARAAPAGLGISPTLERLCLRWMRQIGERIRRESPMATSFIEP